MGADVMRWQYCAQPPNQNLLFGFGPGREIQRKLLTLWNSVKFFVDYANIDVFQPTWGDLPKASELRPLDRWLIDRTHALVREAEAGYEAYLTRSTSSAPSRRSSTISPTGTSVARDAASGTATALRCTCSGSRSCSPSA